MGDIRLPELPAPAMVDVAHVGALARQIETWAQSTDDGIALEDARAKTGAIEMYLRRRDRSAAAEIARAARRLAVRVGRLLGPARMGPPEMADSSSQAWELIDRIPKNDRHRLRKMAMYADEPAVAEAIERGASQTEVLKIIRYLEDERRDTAMPSLHDLMLLHCGVVELPDHVEPGSVDVIVTDPPYPREFLGCYSELALSASKVLAPGGMVVAMVGQIYLPEIMRRLGEHLEYRWTIAYLTPGGQAAQIWPRKMIQFWKPVLVYTNGSLKDEADWVGDVTRSAVNDNDKHRHRWGQSESGMADLMKRVTSAGDVVCDPFLGGGTTAVVSLRLGCRFIGCDTDPTAIASTRERLGLT